MSLRNVAWEGSGNGGKFPRWYICGLGCTSTVKLHKHTARNLPNFPLFQIFLAWKVIRQGLALYGQKPRQYLSEFVFPAYSRTNCAILCEDVFVQIGGRGSVFSSIANTLGSKNEHIFELLTRRNFSNRPSGVLSSTRKSPY